MNEKQALQAGYTYTGIYERNYKRDIVKARAAKLRKAGNKAVMVNTGRGVSVYWIESEQNKKVRRQKRLAQDLVLLGRKYKALIEEQATIEEKMAEMQAELAQLNQ